MMEQFFVRRRVASADWSRPSAREVDAFVVLEDELAKEMKNGQQHARYNL